MSQDYETKQSELRASRDATGGDRTVADDPLLELARIVHKNKQTGAHVSSGRVGSTDYFAGLDDVSEEGTELSGRREPTFAQVLTGAQTRVQRNEPAGLDAGRGERAAHLPDDYSGTPVHPVAPATGRSSDLSAVEPRSFVSGPESETRTWPQETGQPAAVGAAEPVGRQDLHDPHGGQSGRDEPSSLTPSLPVDLEQNLTAELEDELIGALRQSVDESKPVSGYRQVEGEKASDLHRSGATAAPVQPESIPSAYSIASETTSLDASVKANTADEAFGPAATERRVSERDDLGVPGVEADRVTAAAPQRPNLEEPVRPPQPVVSQRPRIDENDLFAALNPGQLHKDPAPQAPHAEDAGEPAGIDALFADLDFPPPSERKAAEIEPAQAKESTNASDIDDMTWPAAAAAVPQTETADETPPPPEGYDLDAVARAMQESDPSLTGAGVLPPHSAAEKNAIPQSGEKSRRGLVVAFGVLGVAVIGAAGFFLFDGDGVVVPSGPPPVISGLQEPLKIFPEDSGAPADDQSAKLDYSRVDGTAVSGPERLVLPESPQPAELPPAPAGTADTSELAPGTPKRVRTVIVRPDGSFVSEDEAAAPEAGTPVAAEPVPGDMAAAPDAPEPAAVATQPVLPAPETAQSEPVPSVPEPAAETPAVVGDTPDVAATPDVAEPAATVPSVLPRRKPDAPVRVAATQPASPAAVPAAQNDGPLNLSQQAAAPAAQASPPATAPAPASTASIPSGTYIVQVTSQRSEAAASDAYSGLQRRFPAILGNRTAVIVSATVEDRGVFYRARIPTGSREEAISLCESLQAAGGDCFVRRQP
ncbi:MAG: hypothetical protein Tsb0019_07600 [Roseibium sp.]